MAADDINRQRVCGYSGVDAVAPYFEHGYTGVVVAPVNIIVVYRVNGNAVAEVLHDFFAVYFINGILPARSALVDFVVNHRKSGTVCFVVVLIYVKHKVDLPLMCLPPSANQRGRG